MPATYDDVNLILRLYELRREPVMREARSWFRANCRPKSMDELLRLIPTGSKENDYYRQVTSHFEMVASFITGGVLSKELFFQSGLELLLVYVRVRAILPEIRLAYKNEATYRNLEKVALDYVQWLEKNGGPGAFDAFVARVG